MKLRGAKGKKKWIATMAQVESDTFDVVTTKEQLSCRIGFNPLLST